MQMDIQRDAERHARPGNKCSDFPALKMEHWHINGAFPGFVPALTKRPWFIDKSRKRDVCYRGPPTAHDSARFATRCERDTEGSHAAVDELHGLWLLWLVVYTARTIKTALNVNNRGGARSCDNLAEEFLGVAFGVCCNCQM